MLRHVRSVAIVRRFGSVAKDYGDVEVANDLQQNHSSYHGGRRLNNSVRVAARYWELTEFGQQFRQNAPSYRREGLKVLVASYNILSQTIIGETPYLYTGYAPSRLKWTNRRRLIIDELLQLNPDIATLQEVERDHWFEPGGLKDVFRSDGGYESVYVKKTQHRPDGIAIIYKRNKFRAIKTVPIEMDRYRQQVPLLNKPTVALIMVFEPVSPPDGQRKARLCIANTHIYFNPKRGDVKLCQFAVLFSELSKIRRQYDNCPVVLSGDLNALPQSPLMEFVRSGSIRYGNNMVVSMMAGFPEFARDFRGRTMPRHHQNLFPGRCPIISSDCEWTHDRSEVNNVDGMLRHSFRWNEVYPKQLNGVTTSHRKEQARVDHILFSHLQLLSRYSLLSAGQLNSVGRLPNSPGGWEVTIFQ